MNITEIFMNDLGWLSRSYLHVVTRHENTQRKQQYRKRETPKTRSVRWVPLWGKSMSLNKDKEVA